jgi:acyl carrier protein
MDRKDVLQQVNAVFHDVLDDTTLVIEEETTANDVDDWDSLNHITLITAIESEFDMKFEMKEILNMKNVGEMLDIITSRMKK